MLHFCAYASKAKKTFLLSAVLLFTTLLSFAHRVELYSNTGCSSGSTLTVGAIVLYAPSTTYYNWQYKDNSGTWKCFTASTVINGVTFAVTNYQSGPAANACPTLSIANATTALENVQVRVEMSENVRPCGAPAGTQIWGGDDQALNEVKMFRLHVYSNPTDCGGTTPGCAGNFLISGSNYYGGFESMVYNGSSSTFTNNNFASGAGSTDYTQGGNNSTVPATSGTGTYQVLNNPYGMNNSNGKFAPHTGNFQLVIDGTANSQKKAWYKTVTVVPGSIYNFSTWIARTQGSNAFNVKLTVNGTDINTSAVSTTIGTWNQIAGSYTVPAGVTSIVISISDVSTSADRFFSLDDICFARTSAVMSLGNRVFYDTNNNGINDGENGIQGVTVHLYNDVNNDNVADGAAIATDVTDVDGFYSFDNLPQGNYIVGAVIPAGYMSSTVNGGDPDNNIDLDDNGQVFVGNEVRGLAITLTAESEPGGNTNGTYDFGFLPDCTCTTSAGNLLVNGSFENGTTGWTATGGTLTTGTGYIACGAANGFNNSPNNGTVSKVYQDVNMPAGSTVTFKGFAGIHTPGLTCSPTLSLIFLNSAGAVLSQSDVAVTRDVDVNHAQLQQYTITAVAPAGSVKVRVQSSTTCNTMKLDAFCLTAVIPVYTLGNTVWYDVNNNGTQDSGEPGIPGATVKLYDCAGTYLNQTATTDGNGVYQFTNLYAGSYIVGVTPPAGYTKGDVGTTNVGADLQNDGTALVGAEVRTACFTTTGSTNNIDFGLKATGALGDFVFADNNGNGIQDAGEPGIAGVTVTLSASGFAARTTTTNANGIYAFTNLAAGTYTVTFTTPAGLTATTPNVGTNDAVDSDPVGGVAAGITLAAGQTNNTIDAGFYSAVNLGNYVWYDRNNDGIQQSTEHGVQGVTVHLYKDANGDNLADGAFIASTITDANGLYAFNSLAPGKYIVGITVPSGYAPAYTTASGLTPDNDNPTDNNGVTIVGNEVTSNFITLTAGGEPAATVDGDGTSGNLTLDFGLKGLGQIGDFVWRDVNRDGVQQAGEPGITKVSVSLAYPDGFVAQQFTADDGSYSFKNLPAGTYSVSFVTPVGGYIPAPSNAGTNDLVDSDPIGGVVSNIVLAVGEVNNSIDAGFIEQISLSGNVWHDVNGNDDNLVNNSGAVQTPPAAAIPTGLRATLVDANTGLVVGTALVLGNGTFNFVDVLPGAYIVIIGTIPGTIGQLPPFATLPNGWENTGEHLGAGPGHDPVINGKLSVTIATTDVNNANFGIRLSNSDIGVD